MQGSSKKDCNGELYLVGLGLWSKMLTLEALEIISAADRVFLETYTSLCPEEIINLVSKTRLDKDIFRLSRRDIEDKNAEIIMNGLLRGEKIAILVYGDPLVATTHNSLRLEAIRLGCAVKYIPGISIYQYAISLTGLFNYKFGPSTTVVFPRWNIKYTSHYKVINENLERDLHTFVFMDIDEKLGPMTPNLASRLLLEASYEFEKRNLTESSLVIILERLGGPYEKVYCRSLSRVMEEDWRNPPYSMIVPSKLHFIEKDVLVRIGLGCHDILERT